MDYGYLPIAVCLLGTFLLAMKGGRRNYGLVLGLLAVLVILVAFFTFHYGLPVMYERGLMFLMLMVGLIAGAGLAGVKEFQPPENLFPRIKIPPLLTRHAGKTLALALAAATLAVIIPARQDTGYYQMIDTADYRAFVWIRENLPAVEGTAILDPWKATAFTAVTGRPAYSRIHAFPTPRDEEAYRFLQGGSANTTFLEENGISLVYTTAEVKNPHLTEVRKNVYLLPEEG